MFNNIIIFLQQLISHHQKYSQLAANVIAECHPEILIPDSRYLASSALTELINNIIQCSLAISPTTQQSTAPIQQQHKHENVHQHGPRQQHESQGSQSQG